MANSDLIYRTTGSVTFWTRTTQEAKGKLNAMEGITGPDDGEVVATIEWVEHGKPTAPAPAAMDEEAEDE